jgi:FtsZ-binding cell division protein ZapB
MINFDELKQKAIDAVTVLSDKASEVYSKAEVKTKEIAKTTQLNAEIVREKNNIKKLTSELGSMYYQLFKDAPDESLAQLCAEITAANENIAALQKMIDEIKASGAEDDDVEVEIVTDEQADGEESCGCGCQQEEEPCTCEEDAQKQAEDACGCGCQEENEAEAEPEAETPAEPDTGCGCGCDNDAE